MGFELCVALISTFHFRLVESSYNALPIVKLFRAIFQFWLVQCAFINVKLFQFQSQSLAVFQYGSNI